MKVAGTLCDAMAKNVQAGRKFNMSMERISDHMGLGNPWSLYKHVAAGSLPANLIRPFENACRATFVTQHLAASTGNHILVKVPTGRVAGPSDVALLQEACTAACSAVLLFYRGKGDNDANGCIAAINHALQRLVHERGQIEKTNEPELEFDHE